MGCHSKNHTFILSETCCEASAVTERVTPGPSGKYSGMGYRVIQDISGSGQSRINEPNINPSDSYFLSHCKTIRYIKRFLCLPDLAIL